MAVCPHCRIHYNKDEDGCCSQCGHPYECECNGLEDEEEGSSALAEGEEEEVAD